MVVHRMMANNPAERFQTPAELADELQPFCLLQLGVTWVSVRNNLTKPVPSHGSASAQQSTTNLVNTEKSLPVAIPMSATQTAMAGTVANAAQAERRKWLIPAPMVGSLSSIIGVTFLVSEMISSAPDENGVGPNPNNAKFVDNSGGKGKRTPPFKKAVIPIGESPFDKLRREDIPEDELRIAGGGDKANAPAELVAILGDRLTKQVKQNKKLTKSLLFSPDGKYVVAEVYSPQNIYDVASAMDNRHFLTANGDGSIYVFRIPQGLRERPFANAGAN